jgi:cellulose synthase/poly-beta-1,6-N-acetylglucosamine synthase-like glycosyltransferase
LSFDLFLFLCRVLVTILSCLFLLSITVQLAYVLCIFARVFAVFRTEKQGDRPAAIPVSVIICAKNEADNLRKNLPAILSQRYTNDAGKWMYEVIVVNDASDDDTEKVLYELSQQYSQLWSVNIAKDEVRDAPGKKYALATGVGHASHSLLVMTDADCSPSSTQWLSNMVKPLTQGKQIVAGVGLYEKTRGWLNAFIRWETIHSFLQYSSYAKAGMPYMAVGRNLACTKEAFYKAKQSPAWTRLPSGDDDLLVNAVADGGNMEIVAHPGALTVSPAKATLQEWIAQKQRHVSTSKYYKTRIILTLGLYACIHALAWLLFLILLFVWDWQLTLAVMALRCAIFALLWHAVAKKLGERFSAVSHVLFDIGWMVYNFAFSPYIIWKNKQQWK